MTDPLDRLYERLLVLRCQAGDERAFAELVGRYSPRLRIFLRKMLDDAHAAEDALQDAWLDAFRGVGRLNDLDAFGGWLYRIARDRAYRILRRRGVRTRTIDDADVALAEAPAESSIDATEDRELVNASLDQLPHAQREVLLLRFIEDMSYEQIAAAVGCEVGTVRSRLHYAKRALRRAIEERNGSI